MKNLKTIRKHKSTEEGFSLVMAAGFGLVMMIIGLTIVSRSIKDNSVSASQKINNRSLAAAESGVSAYLSLLKTKNSLATMQFVNNIWTTTNGSLNPYTATETASTQGWQDLVAGDATKGQYRLLSYVAPVAGQAILRVQGRVNQRGTGTTATEDISTGMTTVEAIIGVTSAAPITSGNPIGNFPGMWLKTGPNNGLIDTTKLDNGFNAYGRVSPSTPNTTLWTRPNPGPGDNANDEKLRIQAPNASSTLPDMSNCLPTMPSPSTFSNSVDLATRINNGDRTFPTASDKVDMDGVYRYFASKIDLSGNTVIQFKSSAKVIVYLQGNMTTGGTSGINCVQDGNATCDLNDLVIYGYGTTNAVLAVNGGNTVEAFIIAPGYSVGVAGAGSPNTQGGYKGALWANKWSTEVEVPGVTKVSNANKYVVNQIGDTTQDLACPYTNTPTIRVINQKVS